MKTLYISDLDGTLLRSNERTSEFTNETINELTASGMIFSYATARSLLTAKKVTQGMSARIPLIVYNGAFIIDNLTEHIMISNYFDKSVEGTFEDLFAYDIYPIVYSYMDGIERFSYMKEKCTRGMRKFLESRRGDRRANPVASKEQLMAGSCFYITCIDEPEKLEGLYEKYREQYHVVYQRDIYSGEQWLEIMSEKASKSNAILQLKEKLGCDRLIVFGDGKNDIDMFEIADECYAVENAVPELKEIATGIIGSNDEDGVACWLRKQFVSALRHKH